MPALESAHGSTVAKSDFNEVGRDMTVNKSSDERLSGHNIANVRNSTIIIGSNPLIEALFEPLGSMLYTMFSYLRSFGNAPPSRAENVENNLESAAAAPLVKETENVPENSMKGIVSEDKTTVVQFPKYDNSNARLFKDAPIHCGNYVANMLPLQMGYPLWLPQPDKSLTVEYRRTGIEFGDIGVITRKGGFDFLFNVRRRARDSINSSAHLPDDFGIGDQPEPLMTAEKLLYPGQGKYSNFIYIKPELNADTNDITFKCQDENAGAILALPDGASEADLLNDQHWINYIFKNCLNWYKYARDVCGRKVDRHSLYFITGYTKSKSWGIATFDKSGPDRDRVMVIGESNDARKQPPYIWKKSGGATFSKSGPSPDPAVPYKKEKDGDETDTPDNQCLFIRGFKISLSEKAWAELWDQTGSCDSDSANNFNTSDKGKSKVNSSRGGSEMSSTGQESGNHTKMVPTFPIKDTLFHPSNEINNIMFCQIPEARIAITHDDTWCSFFKNLKNQGNAKQMSEIIRTRFDVKFDEEFKAVTLESKFQPILMTKHPWQHRTLLDELLRSGSTPQHSAEFYSALTSGQIQAKTVFTTDQEGGIYVLKGSAEFAAKSEKNGPTDFYEVTFLTK